MADPTFDDILSPNRTPGLTANTKALVQALKNVWTGLGNGGVSRTPSAVAATSDGSTVAGKKSVALVAGATFSGSVLGQPLAAGGALFFEAPAGDTVGAIAYTRSAGTLYIYYLT